MYFAASAVAAFDFLQRVSKKSRYSCILSRRIGRGGESTSLLALAISSSVSGQWEIAYSCALIPILFIPT